jgi:hypothetical protein
MTGRLRLAGGCAALALVISLLTAGGSTADRLQSRARAASTGAGCKLTVAPPTEANDQITGKGTIRCKTLRTVHFHIETQLLERGRWFSFGSFDDVGFHVRAGRTRHVSTGPANCKGLGKQQMRTILRLGRAGGSGPEAISPTVTTACSEHHR